MALEYLSRRRVVNAAQETGRCAKNSAPYPCRDLLFPFAGVEGTIKMASGGANHPPDAL
jgi:hypothetical protein